jgi:arsenate reductase (thioredoxin)
MTGRTYNVLFLCTGNSARSILAEGILRKDGEGRFTAYSAGSQPKGTVNPLALKVLGDRGYPTDGYRSKSWDEFAAPGAPVMDFVLTICDSAAGEACPVWLGHPSIAHWSIEDPAAVEGSDADKEQAFLRAFEFLKSRTGRFIRLLSATFDQFGIGTRFQAIGHSEGAGMTAPSG